MSITKTLEALAAKRAEIAKEAQQVLGKGLQEFMAEHPEVKAIQWSQYTPYFNDGETCEFSVHGLEYTTTDVNEENEDEDGDLYSGVDFDYLSSYKKPDDLTESAWRALLELSDALESAGDDLQATFGDHVRVIVTKKGITTEEVEHD